jgi:hypothetical protein
MMTLGRAEKKLKLTFDDEMGKSSAEMNHGRTEEA